MTVTKATMRSRAERGAKLLDRKMPGWWRKVKMNNLSMASADRCILGQAYMNYQNGQVFEGDGWTGFDKGLKVLFKQGRYDDGNKPSEYGFSLGMHDVSDDQYRWNEDVLWEWLAEAWIDLIRQRRRAAKSATTEPHAVK